MLLHTAYECSVYMDIYTTDYVHSFNPRFWNQINSFINNYVFGTLIYSYSIYVIQTWSYYEKWVSSMCIMLLERGVILESELYEELDGDSLSRSGSLNEVPKFNPGDKIKIRSESTRVRWRRPHIRCLTSSITHE